jgi:alkylation response protein AidB-like acyl-CoA dehydrogenase
MDLSYSAEYEAFRAEVRAFVKEHWADLGLDSGIPSEEEALIGSLGKPPQHVTDFRIKAIERGYLYRGIPKRYGGGEQPFDPLKSTIIGEEFKAVKAPGELVGQGASMLAPTLIECGTEEQKEKFVRETLLGNIMWCQGYSEPEAGSDLASLRCKAELVGDEWVVNGQKIWTSNADQADWMFCLVRSDPDKPKHQGITYLLIDMKTPGLDVRPLRQMTGEVDFYEVFLEDVRVPKENMVGERGQGWAVSKSTLKHERALIGGSTLSKRMLDGLVMFSQFLALRGPEMAIKDPVFRDRLVSLQARLLASHYHGYRLLTMQARGKDPGVSAMVTKLYGSQLCYDIGLAAMDLLGDRGMFEKGEKNAVGEGMFPHAYMWTMGMLIGGGTTNIQRNVIAERGLGMPRDPSSAKK